MAAQVIVGIMEFKKGNTFGTVAFTSYGLFWWSLVALLVSAETFLLQWMSLVQLNRDGSILLHVGLFTFAMFFGTLKANRALQFVFMSLCSTVLHADNKRINLATRNAFNTIIGIEGVICGSSAVYLGLAEVLNEAHDKTVLPICPVK